MNKTVSVNIGGFIFHIEEEAYNKLRNYIETIRGYFQETEGRDEIIGDIEARIAEMFNSKVTDSKQVIVMKDVDEVIEIMGQPEAFIEADEEASSTGEAASPKTSYRKRNSRRVFRDPDNDVIGGVCGGIGAYFDIDPIWLRLAFVASVIFFGTGILLYIILWVIIPEAKTTSDKLEMRGEPVNVENIEKSVREEIDILKTKYKDLKVKAYVWDSEQTGAKAKNFFQRLLDFLVQLIKGILKFFGKFFGVILVILGIVLFMSLMGAFLGFPSAISITDNGFHYHQWNAEVLDFIGTSSQMNWGTLGLILLLGIPLLAMIYGGIKIIFGVRYRNRMIGRVLGTLWLLGLVLSIVIGIQIGKDYRTYAKERSSIGISQDEAGEVLYLELTKNQDLVSGYPEYYDDEEEDWSMPLSENGNIMFLEPKFDILRSDNDSMYLEVIKSSQGATKKQSFKRASNISYSVVRKDSVLQFGKFASIFKQDMWRGQKVKLVLRLPVGQTVFLGKDMVHIIYDIDNVSNTWDGDMVNRRWKMTERGLECVDCEGLEIDDDETAEWDKQTKDKKKFEKNMEEFDKKMEEFDLKLQKEMDEMEKEIEETFSYEVPVPLEIKPSYSTDHPELKKFDKSKERFDYEMKRKLNEIYFEMRNQNKESAS